MRFHPLLAGFFATTLGMIGGFAAAEAPIPAALAVPEDLPLLLRARAEGFQIYVCAPGKDDPNLAAWSLKAPEATLFNQAGKVIGKHFAGPAWALSDGSLVTGEVTAKDPGPVANAIPWLRLTVISNSGKGMLRSARAIQRIDTEGGLAPAGNCDAGQEFRAPYRAIYQFFGPKP
jgi:hypothetical protein